MKVTVIKKCWLKIKLFNNFILIFFLWKSMGARLEKYIIWQTIYFSHLANTGFRMFQLFSCLQKKKDMCLKMILIFQIKFWLLIFVVYLVHSLLISSLKMCNRQNYTESNGHFKVLKFKQLYKQESFIYHPSRCLPMSPYLFQKQYFLPIIETLSPLMISTSKLRTRTI